MMFRKLTCLVLGLSVLALAAVGDAADNETKARPVADKVVESAFALKKGVVLRPDQQQAYEALRQEQGPKLREALEKSGAAADKNAAALAVAKIRADVKKELSAILRQPAPPGYAPPQPLQMPRRCSCGRR
jgi:hypothetical protein